MFFTGPYFIAIAVPWGGRVWLDVVALGLTIINSAGCAALCIYHYSLERALIEATITEAEVATILAARRRLGGYEYE